MTSDASNTKGLHKGQCIGNPVSNQNGSVIVIALLVLVAMTLGGVTATQRSITESFTVRNAAIHKQNLQLAEMAAMEGAGRIMMEDSMPDLMHAFGHDVTAPDETETLEAVETGLMNALLQRRGTQTLEFYTINAGVRPGDSLTQDDRITLSVMVLGVYESDDYGRKTVEVGVQKLYSIE